MSHPPRNLAILGSTGSIGCSTLEVVRKSAGKFRVVALSAHKSIEKIRQQAAEFQPRWVVTSEALHPPGSVELPASSAEWLSGVDAICRVVRSPEVDIVVSAVVGSAGLAGTWAAIEAGKTVALANKETLVMAGPLVMQLAKEKNSKILPVDSEHSAVFQAIAAGRQQDIKRIVLTASGGPFRKLSKAQMQAVTVDQALSHPTWQMGPKITVDSATMMNKALEIIEARWLFDLPPEMIDVVVHPQSIVHSLVEYVDGSVLAQLSPPDMKLPIQYALTYPERWESPARKLDLTQAFSLDFEPPDEDRFPALKLGKEVAKAGGTAGAVLNAANEAAVAGFLAGKLGFMEIVPACRTVLENHPFDSAPSLARLYELDTWARQEVAKWIGL